MTRYLIVLALGVFVAASSGCSIKSTTTLDPNMQACIDAGGSFSKPVEDGVGFRCDMLEATP